MFHKKTKSESLDATCASVQKEMAKPRMAKSARAMERKLNILRTPFQATAKIAGIVVKIIPPPHPTQPEKAQITLEGTGHQHRDLRIENSLTDQNGHEVKLKKGARIRVIVAVPPKPSIVS